MSFLSGFNSFRLRDIFVLQDCVRSAGALEGTPALDPRRHFLKRSRIKGNKVFTPDPPSPHKVCAFEEGDVLGNRVQRNAERLREFGYS
jgi:hypothetical protein